MQKAETARNTILLPYSPTLDRYIDDIAKGANRVFCISIIEAEKPPHTKSINYTNESKPNHVWIILMCRTFESVRMGAKDVSVTLKKED